jgi:hypothetical protein
MYLVLYIVYTPACLIVGGLVDKLVSEVKNLASTLLTY